MASKRATSHSGNESWASSAIARATMQANRSRDTRPERLLRSALHAAGLRFRVSARPVPTLNRTADVVFRPARVAVFIDGCFWHGCPTHRTAPRANADYWADKIRINQNRDRQTDEQLAFAGWEVIRVWEHEDIASATARIADAVHRRRQSPRPARPDITGGLTAELYLAGTTDFPTSGA